MKEIQAIIICNQTGYNDLVEELGEDALENFAGVSIMDDEEFADFICDLTPEE